MYIICIVYLSIYQRFPWTACLLSVIVPAPKLTASRFHTGRSRPRCISDSPTRVILQSFCCGANRLKPRWRTGSEHDSNRDLSAKGVDSRISKWPFLHGEHADKLINHEIWVASPGMITSVGWFWSPWIWLLMIHIYQSHTKTTTTKPAGKKWFRFILII